MADDGAVELRACARAGRDDLERQPFRGDPGLVEERLQTGDELAVVDHAVRDVDGDAQHVPLRVPLVQAAQRVARDGQGERPHERRALDVRDELGGADQVFTAYAAHERLGGSNDA